MGIIGNGITLSGGMGIKSIQRGVTSVPRSGHYSPAQEVDSIINQVDLTKAILVYGGQGETGSNVSGTYVSYARLKDATHVGCAVRSQGSDSSNIDVFWTVVEFEDGVEVQRGLAQSTGSAVMEVSITPVDLAKSFVVHSGCTVIDQGSRVNNSLELIGSDQIRVRLSNGASSGTTYVPWQVVEFE